MIKIIKNFENYSINDKGEVYNNKTNKKLKKCISSTGYYYIQLVKDKRKYMKYIHRLVAEAFIENKDNKEQVDHINGNKLDNDKTNLRWVTTKENYYAYGYENRKLNRRKKVYAIKDDKILEFNSRLECAKYFNCDTSKIKYNYLYKKSSKKGYIFKLKI